MIRKLRTMLYTRMQLSEFVAGLDAAKGNFKTILRGVKDYQYRILVLYKRVMRKALGDYIKIFKHAFFMKYFRVFFEHTTGFKELELRYI